LGDFNGRQKDKDLHEHLRWEFFEEHHHFLLFDWLFILFIALCQLEDGWREWMVGQWRVIVFFYLFHKEFVRFVWLVQKLLDHWGSLL
jgi:hypothetical protein